MSLTMVVRCDGTPDIRPTLPIGQCRAAYPARATDPAEAVDEAVARGWRRHRGEHLCPSCSRYVQ